MKLVLLHEGKIKYGTRVYTDFDKLFTEMARVNKVDFGQAKLMFKLWVEEKLCGLEEEVREYQNAMLNGVYR